MELSGIWGFAGCPFALPWPAFCLAPPPAVRIAGGIMAGEALVLALEIEPPALPAPFDPPIEGTDTMLGAELSRLRLTTAGTNYRQEVSIL